MSQDTEDWCKIWRKADVLFQKWPWWILIRALKISKICILIGPFCEKYMTFDLKKYRGVIFHDTEDSCKIWRKTGLWFGKWHKEFGKFSPEHSKIWRICTLMGYFWPKYMFELRKSRGVVWWHSRLMQSLKENWLVLPKMTWWIGQIFIRARSKVKKLGLSLGPFIQSRKRMSLKFSGELCAIKVNNDSKFEEELTCQFKIDMRNLINFDLNTQKFQKFAH